MARTPPACWQKGFSSRVWAVLRYALATSFSWLESPSAVLRDVLADVFSHVQSTPTIESRPKSGFASIRPTECGDRNRPSKDLKDSTGWMLC